MRNVLLFISILFVTQHALSQDLVMRSGNKSKTIKTGTFIEIELPSPHLDSCRADLRNTMSGRFLAYENGQIRLHLYQSNEPLIEQDRTLGYHFKKYTPGENGPVMNIPAGVVMSIKLKGKRSLVDTPPLDGVAIVLGSLGVGSLVSALYAEDAELLAIVGATELATGILLGVLAKQKRFITSEQCPFIDRKARIWTLN